MQSLIKTNEGPNNFEQTKGQLLENYKSCGLVAFYLPAAGASWVWSKLKGDRSNNNMGNSIGFYSAVFMIPLTPVTIASGAVAALANTVWGLYALPAAKVKDNYILREEEKQLIEANNASQLASSSTMQVMQTCGVQKSSQHVQMPLTNSAQLIKPTEKEAIQLNSALEEPVESVRLSLRK